MPTATLKDLKDAINKAFQVEFQLFVFGGKHLTDLKDGQTLESLSIKNASTIQTTGRVQGGK